MTLPIGRPHEGLRRIAEYTSYLRQLAQTPEAQFTADFVLLGSAKYYLMTAIEACLDLAQHVIARRGWRTPNSYADTFDVLAEHGLVPADFLPRLRSMARFRNRLVHLYWDVDPQTLYALLQSNLGDFDRFAALMLPTLSASGDASQEGDSGSKDD
ncbi:MAG: hypothetical protein AVDCRST_MAG77-1025 [uncultured Chloroflexi bacterium]|uniref:DUF86 domain-containing protein n=1 Tax=uncultured Chloroflexota bacterium TaxID=166587 RepID=A0A6J4HQD8_9CHLR|nr:MAG: hypothetical protein AVDCRST_MAG77-1025 [uncultured Chloroflexota bacterium]